MFASESPLVRKLGSFMPLMPDELRCVAELESTRRSVEPQTEIVYEGQKDHAAWLLLDGWANSYKLVPDGGRQIIGFPLPGDFMGLRSILLRTSDHSFESLTDAVISEVSQQRITQIFEDLPRLATAIMWGTSRDEAMVVEHLVSIGRRSAIERTAHFFLELGQRLALIGRVTNNGFACPLNQYVLADALGLSAIHVNRILRQLRERGLITLKAQQVVILDLAGLEDLAGFDSGYLNHGHSGHGHPGT